MVRLEWLHFPKTWPISMSDVLVIDATHTEDGRLSEWTQHDKAKYMYLRALAGYEKALGLHRRSTLGTVNHLGGLYRNQGKLDKAEQIICRQVDGWFNPRCRI